MSIKAICEVVLYFQSFKNIDLGEQGIYLMKARIKSNNQYAPPHRNFQSSIELKSRKKNKIRDEPELQDNQYKTKSFLIRYNDQEIDLEEVVVFRLELQTLPNIATDNIYMYIDLYYAHDINYGFQFQKHRDLNFQKIDTAKLRLNNVDRGMASFSPVMFSSNYKSTIKLYVFSMMMDMKFRTWKLSKKDKTQKQIQRQQMTSLKQYFDFYLKKTNQGEGGFYRKHIKTLIQFSQQAKKTLLKISKQNQEYKYRLPKYCLADKETSLQLVEVQPKTYMQYINMYKIQKYQPKMFQDQVQQISAQNHIFFQSFLMALAAGNLNKQFLKQKQAEFRKERFGQFIFKSQVKQDDLSGDKCSVKEKQMLAKKIRNKKDYFQNLQSHEIEDDSAKLSEHPIIFHELTEVNKERQRKYQVKNQLFVLSHGFQGSSDDMVTIKNNIKIFNPKGYFLLARSNEGQTDGNISKMGERLANEIKEYIKEQNIQQGLIIHFIGHSLGGVILRASLKHLDMYKQNLGTYVSFSSPHLSYLNGTKTSIQTGLWVIKILKKMQSLDQMTMSDNKNLQQTFMFKLSKQGSIKDFHRIVLIASPQDSYVPWHSARIHRSSNWSGQSIALQNMMTNQILSNNVRAIHRIGVDFFISQRNIDSVIGRAAHIRFLSDQTVLEMILSSIPQMFK